MTIPLQHVREGDYFSPSARTLNAMMDAAAHWQRNSFASGGSPIVDGLRPGEVWLRNDCGEDRDLFEVLGLDGFLVTETQNASEFKFNVAFKGAIPDRSTHTSRFVVLQEPIKDGAIGRAMLCGYTPCLVQVAHPQLEYADITNDDATKLSSAGHGSARIIIAPASSGLHLCYVQLGVPGMRILPGKTTGSHGVNAVETIQILDDDGDPIDDCTVEALNPYANLLADKRVTVAYVGTRWELLAGKCEPPEEEA